LAESLVKNEKSLRARRGNQIKKAGTGKKQKATTGAGDDQKVADQKAGAGAEESSDDSDESKKAAGSKTAPPKAAIAPPAPLLLALPETISSQSFFAVRFGIGAHQSESARPSRFHCITLQAYVESCPADYGTTQRIAQESKCRLAETLVNPDTPSNFQAHWAAAIAVTYGQTLCHQEWPEKELSSMIRSTSMNEAERNQLNLRTGTSK
jgi:hypothetical protein